MSKKITFIATDPYAYDVAPRPYPANQAVPKWWKDMAPHVPTIENPDGLKLSVNNYTPNFSFKKCTPMLDAIISGYVLPLWADVVVTQTLEGPRISWKVGQTNEDTMLHSVFLKHGHTSEKVPPPPGYSNHVFKYINPWIPKTPKGYSLLVTSPYGYQDQPFKAIPAIVDSDRLTLELVPPMWVKEGFEGVVEKGTPLVQFTPFKRDDWESEFSFKEEKQHSRDTAKTFHATIVNHYVKNVWSKKKYK
jgi:hypothetical protein